MVNYDYKAGSKRIQRILKVDNPIEEMPRKDSKRTNGFYAPVTAVNVKIKNSADLFNDEDRIKVAKIVRCISSEIMRIFDEDGKPFPLKDIGTRDDSVRGIFVTLYTINTQELVNRTFHINTYIRMLNKLLTRSGLVDHVRLGIGVAVGHELIIKGGVKGTGIDELFWTGKTAEKAEKLSALGGERNIHPIVISSNTYNVLSETQKRYFLHNYSSDTDGIYHSKAALGSVVTWLNEGMPD